jgi:hypothetical protein
VMDPEVRRKGVPPFLPERLCKHAIEEMGFWEVYYQVSLADIRGKGIAKKSINNTGNC